jgi:pimeloyl-ACP methyl ester carboxylesterase
VPALLISGEVDPVTPPHMAEEVARTLSNARHVVLPGHGHTMSIGEPCMASTLKQFIQTASVRDLDLSCIERR